MGPSCRPRLADGALSPASVGQGGFILMRANEHEELLPFARTEKETAMDFGICTMFNTREGSTQSQTFKLMVRATSLTNTGPW